MAGFIGKFYLFAAVINKGGTFYWVLAIIGVLNSAISLFYYARILKAMFFNKPEVETPVSVPGVHRTMATLMAMVTLVLGIYWAPVVDYIGRVLPIV
jgi:NADH-quinone oxidoreductase subunit N